MKILSKLIILLLLCCHVTQDPPIRITNNNWTDIIHEVRNSDCIRKPPGYADARLKTVTIADSLYGTIDTGTFISNNLESKIEFTKTYDYDYEIYLADSINSVNVIPVSYDDMSMKGSSFENSIHLDLSLKEGAYMKGLCFYRPKLLHSEKEKFFVLLKVDQWFEYVISECYYVFSIVNENEVKMLDSQRDQTFKLR